MTDSIALANDAAAIASAIMGPSVLSRNSNLSPRSASRNPGVLPDEPRNPHARSTTFDVFPSKPATKDSPSTATRKITFDSSPSKQISSLDDEDVDELESLEDVNPDSWLDDAPLDPSSASFARNSNAYRTFTKQARHKQTAQASVAPSSTPSSTPLAAANAKPSGGDQTPVAEVTNRVVEIHFPIRALYDPIFHLFFGFFSPFLTWWLVFWNDFPIQLWSYYVFSIMFSTICVCLFVNDSFTSTVLPRL